MKGLFNIKKDKNKKHYVVNLCGLKIKIKNKNYRVSNSFGKDLKIYEPCKYH